MLCKMNNQKKLKKKKRKKSFKTKHFLGKENKNQRLEVIEIYLEIKKDRI